MKRLIKNNTFRKKIIWAILDMSDFKANSAALKIQFALKLNNCIKNLEKFRNINLNKLSTTLTFNKFRAIIIKPDVINITKHFCETLESFKSGLKINPRVLISAYLISNYTEELVGPESDRHPVDMQIIQIANNVILQLESNKINDLGYRFELPVFNPSLNRKFKFLCLNRVPKAHRIAFLSRLYKNKSIYDTDWSLLFSPYEFTTLFGEELDENNKNIFSIEHFSAYFTRNELQNHYKELKYFFYTKKKSNYEPYSKNLFNFFGDTKSTHYKETYENSFVSLITETSFENNEEHISEKSLKPFINLHLGVFLSPYKHLDRIKKFGFQTFDSIWDESYDNIYNPMERMVAVSSLVAKLNEYNLFEIYKGAEEILIHNQNHFLNFWKRESCKKYFNKISNGI